MSMIKIRKGKDIVFRWSILTNGNALPLQGRDLTLEIVNPYGRRTALAYQTDGNTIVFKFRGTEHTMLGVHGITLWENKDEEGQTAVDISKAFELVRTTEEEDLL
jgi:hypothetical protein|nr:MAG TPA: hypothetical protein [Caudoviricetes sp.]